jgi:hypothetical protein
VFLDDNIMFVSNIRAVSLKKFNMLCVLFPCHNTNEYRDTGIVPALVTWKCTFELPKTTLWVLVYHCFPFISIVTSRESPRLNYPSGSPGLAFHIIIIFLDI